MHGANISGRHPRMHGGKPAHAVTHAMYANGPARADVTARNAISTTSTPSFVICSEMRICKSDCRFSEERDMQPPRKSPRAYHHRQSSMLSPNSQCTRVKQEWFAKCGDDNYGIGKLVCFASPSMLAQVGQDGETHKLQFQPQMNRIYFS